MKDLLHPQSIAKVLRNYVEVGISSPCKRNAGVNIHNDFLFAYHPLKVMLLQHK